MNTDNIELFFKIGVIHTFTQIIGSLIITMGMALLFLQVFAEIEGLFVVIYWILFDFFIIPMSFLFIKSYLSKKYESYITKVKLLEIFLTSFVTAFVSSFLAISFYFVIQQIKNNKYFNFEKIFDFYFWCFLPIIFIVFLGEFIRYKFFTNRDLKE